MSLVSEQQTVESFGFIVNLYSPEELAELSARVGSSWLSVRGHEVSFVQRHPASFRYGWWVLPQSGRRMDAVLYWSGRHWIRVCIVNVICQACGARFYGANPYVIDLYVGQRESAQVMRDIAKAYPNLPCAQCGAKLERREVIWLERDERPSGG